MTNSEQTSVLITGGNKGLGFEAARRLGEQGWAIFLGSRDHDRGRAAAGKGGAARASRRASRCRTRSTLADNRVGLPA
jgi:NAD(P)-dependent dehydrogenase (short-subunit alcohol dehydrogenase family)